MKSLTERYVEYYTPLVSQFIKKLEPVTIPDIKQMPEPFLPLFGKDYEQSALRVIFIGQDTKWWWDLREFIQAEKVSPGSKLKERIDQFWERPFTQWGKTSAHLLGICYDDNRVPIWTQKMGTNEGRRDG